MLSIKSRVEEHARRAYILAQIEQRPPNYTTNAWAVLLMDNSFDKLKARFEMRTFKLKEQAQQQALTDPLFAELSYLPATPEQPPVELATKSMALYQQWLADLVQSECEVAVQSFHGSPRTVPVLLAAREAITRVLARLEEQQGGPVPKVKVTMNDDLTFTVTVIRRSVRSF